MPNKIFNIRMRNKRDTEANWEKKNPLILDGEIIVVTTTSGETRVKIGDGVKTYTQLPFLDEVLKNESKSLGITSATVGQIAKIAAVDASGVPTAWSPADMPSGGSSDLYVDFWPTGSEQYNGNFNGYQVELATDQTFDAIFDSIKAGNKVVARLYKDADKSEETASSVDTAVTGTKEFGAIHFQFVTANADTGAIAGFPFIGEAIMMIKWEEAVASYLIENRNVLPTPNADGTDNGKAPIINGTKWELKTPTVAQEQLTGTTHNLTPTQVYEAVSAGTPVKVQYTDSTYGLLSFTAFNVAETLNKVVSQTIAYYNGVYILAELCGNKTDNRWYFMSTTLAQKTDIPSALPNPNALTFTGAVTGSYDGSEPVTINIPESGAGNMKKLTFTGDVTGEYDGTTDVSIDIPIATTSTAGTIKVGNGLSISADGTLSVTTATYYTGTADPVNTLGADGDLYLKTEG